MLPTLKPRTDHKIIEYLTLGLLSSLWTICHSTTAYSLTNPVCVPLGVLARTELSWSDLSGWEELPVGMHVSRTRPAPTVLVSLSQSGGDVDARDQWTRRDGSVTRSLQSRSVRRLWTLLNWVNLFRCATRCYFNVRSKADMSQQFNLPHGSVHVSWTSL